MTYTYTRANAWVAADGRSRFEYAAHPAAYFYVYAPTGGFGAWTGPRPVWIDVHGGGWDPALEVDIFNERDPNRNMLGRSDTADAFRDLGGVVIVLEYPPGSAFNVTPEKLYPGATHFPRNWIINAHAWQWIKDECGLGGVFYGLLDGTQLVAGGSSAGADQVGMGQWSPKSWNMIARAPGNQVATGRFVYKADHYLKAMVLLSPSFNFAQVDGTRTLGGVSNIASNVMVAPYRYPTWNDIPRATVEAASAMLFLNRWTGSDLVAVRNIPIWTANNGNPSVQYDAGIDERSIVPHYFGADDSYDVVAIEQRLNQLGGFNLTSFWGDDAALGGASHACQNVIDASNTTPIVITTSEEHGVATGNRLKLGVVTGNTAANGVWPSVTRIDPTHFSLDGSIGNGAWTGGGVWCFDNVNGNYSVGTTWTASIVAWLLNVVKISF